MQPRKRLLTVKLLPESCASWSKATRTDRLLAHDFAGAVKNYDSPAASAAHVPLRLTDGLFFGGSVFRCSRLTWANYVPRAVLRFANNALTVWSASRSTSSKPSTNPRHAPNIVERTANRLPNCYDTAR